MPFSAKYIEIVFKIRNVLFLSVKSLFKRENLVQSLKICLISLLSEENLLQLFDSIRCCL